MLSAGLSFRLSKISTVAGRAFCSIAIALLTPLTLQSSQEGGADNVFLAPQFDYSRSRGAVIFEYSRFPAELATRTRTPLLRLHGDGLVVFRSPTPGDGPATVSMRLSEQEVRELLGAVLVKGLVEFHSDAIRSSLRAQARSGGEFISFPDADVSSFELQIERYTPGGSREGLQRDVHKKIVWQHLQQDAARYSGIKALHDLAELENMLQAFLTRADASAPGAGNNQP